MWTAVRFVKPEPLCHRAAHRQAPSLANREGIGTASTDFLLDCQIYSEIDEIVTKDLYSFRGFGTLPLVLSRLPRSAPAWLDRLSAWLEPFEVCFTHVAQRGAFRRYLLGLLSDSRRKSMSAMLERVRDPGTYQAFQHFITDAPWSAEAVWRHLRARFPIARASSFSTARAFPSRGRTR